MCAILGVDLSILVNQCKSLASKLARGLARLTGFGCY